MGRLGVPDRYVDAFCGRMPQSVLAKHYTDYSPERLKDIYDRASPKSSLGPLRKPARELDEAFNRFPEVAETERS